MSLNTFDSALFTNELLKNGIDWSVKFTPKTESTNTDLKRLPSSILSTPIILITDEQTAGRGQFERVWQSSVNQNIICSIAFPWNKQKGVQLVGLLTAVAISESIKKYHITLKPTIKWPNDVLINGLKVAGILIETQFSGTQLEKIVIGFGINVNQENFDESLTATATSIKKASSKNSSREILLAEIISNLKHLMELWEQEDPSVLASIHTKLIGYERFCIIKDLNGIVLFDKAWVLGLDFSGRLSILDRNNNQKWFEHEQIRLELYS